MDGWYSMEDLMLYSKIIANKRYNNPSSPLNAIAGWGGVMRGSNKWCKMSHRDVNARRILSYAVSGVVHNPPVWKGAAASCSASPPPGARLAPDRRASRCSVLWKTDSQTASLLSPQFFSSSSSFPGSSRLAVRSAYGDRLENVTTGNEQWCFQPPEERRRRRRCREGGGGVVVMVMVAVCGEVSEGQNTTGSLAPPLTPPLIPPPPFPSFPLLLILITHTNAREEEEDADPLDRFFVFISALISLLHPSILPLQLRGYHLGITGEKNSDSSHCLRESMKIQTLWRCVITFTHTHNKDISFKTVSFWNMGTLITCATIRTWIRKRKL